MKIALKEWAVVVDAILQGKHKVLLRKGGILDPDFRLEHPQFLFFPAVEHQRKDQVAEPYLPLFDLPQPAPDQIKLECWAEVVSVRVMEKFSDLEKIDQPHIWNRAYLEMRWNYKPEKPLYCVELKAFKLNHPVVVPHLPYYQGCRSWVELSTDVDVRNSSEVVVGE